MSLSYQEVTSDGTLNSVLIGIEYLDVSHLHFFVDKVGVTTAGYTCTVSNGMVHISPAVPANSVFSIIRFTPSEAIKHFYQGLAEFSNKSLDENFKQLLLLTQEASDRPGVAQIPYPEGILTNLIKEVVVGAGINVENVILQGGNVQAASVDTSNLNIRGLLTLAGSSGTAGQCLVSHGPDEPPTWEWVDAVPVGGLMWFAHDSIPEGWLMADGSTVSRSDYPELFTKVGVRYGAGNGTTTFNLPDLRGEFIRGWDAGRGVDTGRVLGSAQADEFQAHSHTITSGPIVGGYQTGSADLGLRGSGGSNSSLNMQVTIGETGGTETRPRNVAMMGCIKAYSANPAAAGAVVSGVRLGWALVWSGVDNNLDMLNFPEHDVPGTFAIQAQGLDTLFIVVRPTVDSGPFRSSSFVEAGRQTHAAMDYNEVNVWDTTGNSPIQYPRNIVALYRQVLVVS